MYIEITEFLSNISNPLLAAIFEWITILAEKYFVVAIACLIYWCIDKKKGERLVFLICGGLGINSIFKNIFRVPRPFDVSDKVNVIRGHTATGYSFPSGHTQNAAVVSGGLMKYTSKNIYKLLLFIYALLVAFSRLILGVHYITDVLAALLIGFLWVFLGGRLYTFCQKRGNYYYFIFTIPSLLALIPLLIKMQKPPEPDDVLTGLGITFGVVFGIILENKHVNFHISKNFKKNTLRYIIGLLSLLLIMFLLKIILPANYICRVIRYFLLGIFATLIYPYIFKKYNL